MHVIDFAEAGLVPDVFVRLGIRQLLKARLRRGPSSSEADFADQLRQGPLAIATSAANDQHYEVPPAFFQHILGPRLKYSACLFPFDDTPLADAEEFMLDETCRRAQLADGMRVLELGCGWGSLTLWMAERYPAAEVTAISNSHRQRQFISEQASQRGLTNVRVITADIRDFATSDKFDRVVSVEMFEHVRNYEQLFRRLSDWLTADGRAFVHIFCHRSQPYLFETEGASNWMGRHFFTGGTMPSENLFQHFSDALSIEAQWRYSGIHYWRTCEAWLKNLDRHHATLLAHFSRDLGDQEARIWLQRWRIFLMACAELFRYRRGTEWFVAHYRFCKSAIAAARPNDAGRVLSESIG